MSAEITAIEQVVATLEHAQHNELVDEFVGLFHKDAIWTTAHGKFLNGRDEIAEFTAQVLPGATKIGLATYEVAHVRFLRPDVAAVKVRQRPVNRDLEVLEDQNEGSPLYIMTKEDGRWLLSAGQNTIVLKD
ncbi:SgcJ/EcaC family oxidoreductase [Actinokineospora soli]|uniref:SgcJ/EcaC family oxidoreductase n=1 Tax=Actinokineospora soli TaxID=1048753 RepID=A0ABW2TIR8_9PSEU